MLMAMVNVVLKRSASTTHLSHNYELFDFKLGKIDYILRITNPAKFGWDRISCGAPHVVVKYRGREPFDIIFFYSFFLPSHEYGPYP